MEEFPCNNSLCYACLALRYLNIFALKLLGLVCNVDFF